MAGMSNIKNQALAERIADHLFQHILDEGMKIGTKLPNEFSSPIWIDFLRGGALHGYE